MYVMIACTIVKCMYMYMYMREITLGKKIGIAAAICSLEFMEVVCVCVCVGLCMYACYIHEIQQILIQWILEY